MDSAIVVDNRTKPRAVANTFGELLCNDMEVLLDGSGSSTGAEFIYCWWSESGHPVQQMDGLLGKACYPGIYTLLVANTLNGCASSARAHVNANID